MRVDHSLEVSFPDDYSLGRHTLQSLVFNRHDGGIDLVVYCNINSAYSIKETVVRSGMGRTRVQIFTFSKSSAVCASVKLCKLVLGFEERRGMLTDFEVSIKEST